MDETNQVQVTITPNLDAESRSEIHRFRFEGKTTEMILLMLVNFVLTVGTFGFYKFWATTKTRKYVWSHVLFDNERFEYSGTGRELFNSAMKVGFIFVLLVLLSSAARISGSQMLQILITMMIYPLIFILIPFAQYSGRNYRLSRTRFRGVRMGMGKARFEYMKTYWIWSILMAMSFYVLMPMRWIRLQTVLINNTKFGSKNLRFSGKSEDIFSSYLMGLFLTAITFGIYYPWHKARLMRYQWDHTHFGDAQFKLAMSGGDLFLVFIESFLAVILTLGLAAPWAIKNYLEFFFYRLALVGPINYAEIQQGDSSSSAVGEEIADFLDVDFGF